MKLIITIAICSLIGCYFWSIEKSRDINNLVGYNTANASRASYRASYIPAVKNLSDHANIDRTLRLVAANWEKTDVNGDGLHNCIDAAVLFYQYYPVKSKVCIESNQNSQTGMNHLFNCVFTDGAWRAIEPQAYATNYPNYLMYAVWGNKYDNSYNRDVTSKFKIYVRN